jgi:AraC family transcriptional regulator
MKPDTMSAYHERITTVLQHIHHNLDAPLSLDDLADVAHFSPFHFHRVFRGIVGESVKEHVRRLRLERAAQQLRSTDRTVIDIALDAGYEAHESFTRAFSEVFDMPPSEFRKTHDASYSSRRSPGGPSRLSNFRIQHFDTLRVVYLRHVGPYDEVGKTWSRFVPWAMSQGLFGFGSRMLGISYDDPEITAPDKLRYDAALVVTRPVAPSGEFGVQELPAGDYAVALHTGPYQYLGDSYAELAGKLLPSTQHELRSAPALEFYLNYPGMTPEDQLQTEICLPIVAAE